MPLSQDRKRELHDRDTRMVAYAASGKTNAEIAKLFVLSPETVHTRMALLMKRHEVHTRFELARVLLPTRNIGMGPLE